LEFKKLLVWFDFKRYIYFQTRKYGLNISRRSQYMSGDEVFAFVVSSIITIIGWGSWYGMLMRIRSFSQAPAAKSLLWLWPPLMVAVLVAILRLYAADDVRNDIRYLSMYAVMGAAWTVAGMKCIALLGISARDDVAERNNPAAIPALLGAMAGIMLSYAGGNIGNGPGWWVVIFSSGLASIIVILSWIFLNILAPCVERITVDRDEACGWRTGMAMTCIGAVAGRGAAGDWVSTTATVVDYLNICWPVLPFVIFASMLERLLMPRAGDTATGGFFEGVIPSIIYAFVTILYLRYVGWYT
jgi:hypothetical protein